MTIEALRRSFAYGSRSNLNFKFLKDLTDDEFGDFVEELLGGVGHTVNDGDGRRMAPRAMPIGKWQ